MKRRTKTEKATERCENIAWKLRKLRQEAVSYSERQDWDHERWLIQAAVEYVRAVELLGERLRK